MAHNSSNNKSKAESTFSNIKSRFNIEDEFAIREQRVKYLKEVQNLEFNMLEVDCRIQDLLQENDEFRLLNLEYERTIKVICSKNRTLKSELESLRQEKLTKNEGNLKRKLSDQDENTNQNKSSPDDVSKLSTELNELKRQNRSLNEKSDRLLQKYQEYKTKYSSCYEDYEKFKADKLEELNQHKQTIGDKQKTIDELNKKVSILNGKLVQSNDPRIKPNINKLQDDYDNKLAMATRNIEENNAKKLEEIRVELQAKIDKLEKEKEILTNRLKTSEMKSNKLEDEKTKLNGENKHLQQNLNAMEKKFNSKNLEDDNLRTEYSELKKKNEDLNRLKIDFDKEKVFMARTQEQYSSEIDRVKKEHQKDKNEYKNFIDKNNENLIRLNNEIEELKDKLRVSENKLEMKQKCILEWQEKDKKFKIQEDLETLLKKYQDRYKYEEDRGKQHMFEYDTKICEIKTENEKLKNENINITSEYVSLSQRCQLLQAELQMCQQLFNSPSNMIQNAMNANPYAYSLSNLQQNMNMPSAVNTNINTGGQYQCLPQIMNSSSSPAITKQRIINPNKGIINNVANANLQPSTAATSDFNLNTSDASNPNKQTPPQMILNNLLSKPNNSNINNP